MSSAQWHLIAGMIACATLFAGFRTVSRKGIRSYPIVPDDMSDYGFQSARLRLVAWYVRWLHVGTPVYGALLFIALIGILPLADKDTRWWFAVADLVALNLALLCGLCGLEVREVTQAIREHRLRTAEVHVKEIDAYLGDGTPLN